MVIRWLSFVQKCEHNRRDENGEMSQKAVWKKQDTFHLFLMVALDWTDKLD